MPAPAPIPAMAPVDSPVDALDDPGGSEAESVGKGESPDDVVAVGPGAVVDIGADATTVDRTGPDVDVASGIAEVASPSKSVPTTTNCVAARSHVAHMSGCDGRTLNLPTPLSQQPAL